MPPSPVHRSRKRRAALCLGLAAVLLLGACGQKPPERVVLITIDTLRADHLGSYGQATAHTPHLDGLAAAGVRFENAISSVPFTLPSHTTLMTGLNPPQHGVRDNLSFRLDASIPTLAERFREGGFATAAFVASVILDRRYGLDRGFDVYGDAIAEGVSGPGGQFPERPADKVVDATLAWLEQAPDRFFLWMHLYDPHSEYTPPPEWAERFPDDPYSGEVAFADAQVGRLLAALQARWPDGGTLVAAVGDHGESLGDHGFLHHGYGLYESTQHVPLLLAGPRVPEGRVVPETVRLTDVGPTLLALADLPPLSDTTGRDLEPVWKGRDGEPRVAYLETLATQLHFGWSPLLGLRTDRYKYVRAPRPELYDLADDPGERQNLAARHPEVVAELDARLDAELESARPIDPSVALSPEDRAQLESLGYVMPVVDASDPNLGVVGGDDPKDKKRAIAVVFRAGGLLNTGQTRQALALLNSVPEEGVLFTHQRAKAYAALGEWDLVERYALKLVEQNARLDSAYFMLARAYWKQGRRDEARAAMEKSIEHNAGSAIPLLSYGYFKEQEGDLEGAEKYYRAALQSRDGRVGAHLILAAFLLEQGRPDESDAVSTDIPIETWAEPEAVIRLAEAEMKAGRGAQALERIAAARRMDPDNPKLVFTYGVFAHRLRDDHAAIESAEASVELDPQSARALNNLAWLLSARGEDLDRALSLAQGAVASAPAEPEFQDTLASVHLARGESGEAVAAASAGLPTAQGETRAHLFYVRAAARSDLGRRSQARSDLAQSFAALGDGLPPPWVRDAAALAETLDVDAPASLQRLLETLPSGQS